VVRPAGSDFVIGYVGQLEPRKRAEDVVGALARLPFGRAIMVGDGKAKQQVLDAIWQHSAMERVTLAGFQRNVIQYYAEFDCIVIPSRDEPFGLVALEAMAAGIPVVAALSGALPEVLGDTALYYPLGDVTALAECIRRLHDEPSLAALLRDRALRRIREFSLNTMIGRIEGAALEAVHLRGLR
jgi:glycosyltransferase involved in cell wall biosynthesis